MVEILAVVTAQNETWLLAPEAHLIIRFGACYYRLTAIHGHRGDQAILQQQVLRERCVHYARFSHNTRVPIIPSLQILCVQARAECSLFYIISYAYSANVISIQIDLVISGPMRTSLTQNAAQTVHFLQSST